MSGIEEYWSSEWSCQRLESMPMFAGIVAD